MKKGDVILLRCINCGNQSSWRDPTCNKCDKPLHQKTCKGRSESCKCHVTNEQIWAQKKVSATSN